MEPEKEEEEESRTEFSRRLFTLDEARELLPRIKKITRRYQEEVDYLRSSATGRSGREAAHRQRLIEDRIRKWCRDILALGAEPKGLWLVDFDSGDGFYFCWRLGEEDIEHIHEYDAGFAGRRRISWR
ncbi:MAG: DUF2203 family protein [Candidatus Hydrogenedentota bacterium]|nr:MAG: DUF2203 family protein [Candidatus Hydrogenedentota bacterium]